MLFGKKEEKRQQEILKTQAEAFNGELQVLLDKYELVLQPSLSYTPQGVVPVINILKKK